MYSDQYPHLHETLKRDNFEVLIETLETHFSGLFQFSVLEQCAENNAVNGSYFSFFQKCIQGLKDLYTSEEIVSKMYKLLNDDAAIRDLFLERLIFVPPLRKERSLQIGFVEKMATGSFNRIEAVTFLDMLRVVTHLQSPKEKPAFWGDVPLQSNRIGVLNLESITPEDCQSFKKDNALMVNFNRDLKSAPKWGAIDLRSNPPRVYCETPLLETEKKALREKLASEFEAVSPGRSDNLISTGYTAIAWLDQSITHFGNFDVNTDLFLLFKNYVLSQFRGDSDAAVKYSDASAEFNNYVTPALKKVLTFKQKVENETNKISGYVPTKLSYFTVLGKINGQPIPLNDLSAVIEAVALNSMGAFNELIKTSLRSSIPAFIKTLLDLEYVREDADNVTLTVPENVNREIIQAAHSRACYPTRTNDALLNYIYQDSDKTKRDMAAGMVLNVFRGLAKKKKISIDLPSRFQLDENELVFLENLLQENAYITELTINDDNASLLNLQTSLRPVFARNRWLAECAYRPPMIDDYWMRAAKYWLIYLNQQPTLLQTKDDFTAFKRCVQEMGDRGLEAVLSLLSNDGQREFIDMTYGTNKPAFYAAYPAHEAQHCLGRLVRHLKQGHYFPFSELGLAYQPGCDDGYLELLTEINHSAQFAQVVLSDCLQHKAALKTFLTALIRAASQHQWVGIIVIPELEKKDAVSEEHRQLRVIYDNLNNIILRNRHLRAAAPLIEKIKAVNDVKIAKIYKKEKKKILVDTDISIDEAFKPFEMNKKWPLKRGGVIQLQLQQQQEIQQSRSNEKMLQAVQLQVVEEAISGECITYATIDRLMGPLFNKLTQKNLIDSRFATLHQHQQESILQGFFRTWINAIPNSGARGVIHSLTKEAAEVLLRHAARFTAGICLHNLPKGFYTQSGQDNTLILCYNPEVGYAHGCNPLTVNLRTHAPVAEAWEGDFRLLQENSLDYRDLTTEDIRALRLFALLQPPKANYSTEISAFQNSQPALWRALTNYHPLIKANWPVFFQYWKYAGDTGIKPFLARLDKPFSVKDALTYFSNTFKIPMEWLSQKVAISEEDLRAFGQVYYQYGPAVLKLIVSKCHQLLIELGDEFFQVFYATVMKRSENHVCFATPAFFEVMDAMIKSFREEKNAGNRAVWLTLLQKHFASVPWENIETLWAAYTHFLAEINELGLEFKGDEFDDVHPENMLVTMDRVLDTLKRLPELDQKKLFLRKLGTLQLTHGGVHYAVGEGFKYVDDTLQLHNFYGGTPTYAPALAKIYSWNAQETALNLSRVLASQAQFSHEDYQRLSERWQDGNPSYIDHLLLLLFTHYDERHLERELANIEAMSPANAELIARSLHKAKAINKCTNQVSLSAVLSLQQHLLDEKMKGRIETLLARDEHASFLETLSIIHMTGHWADGFDPLLRLWESNIADADYPKRLLEDAYKLAALFNAHSIDKLHAFIFATRQLKPIVRNELRVLVNQLLSINYNLSDLNQLDQEANWQDLLQLIATMEAQPTKTAELRIAFMDKLTARGLHFTYSTAGDFRHLQQADRPDSLGFFVDHQTRLWRFLMQHIVIPVNSDSKAALEPILNFFKRLQMNRTYLNEVEPLLSILEKTAEGNVWSSEYFYQLLKALQPESEKVSFPISLVKVCIDDAVLGAKSINAIEKNFPHALLLPLQTIINQQVFSREQQSLLNELALKEFNWEKNNRVLYKVINLLGAVNNEESTSYALSILVQSSSFAILESRFKAIKWLLRHAKIELIVQKNWADTSALWLKLIVDNPSENNLFNQLRDLSLAEDKESLLLHILAWSTLDQGLSDSATHKHALLKKAPKLLQRLALLSEDELLKLTACYPGQPSPNTADLIYLLKQKEKGRDLTSSLDAFLRVPHTEPRADHAVLSKTRELDLQRMLSHTYRRVGDEIKPLTGSEMLRLSLVFAKLKQIQAGTLFIDGFNKPIDAMSREELREAHDTLSKKSVLNPANDHLTVQILAILFQGISHTTKKYPHLAQQFSIITKELLIDTPKSVLILPTGEGKTHYGAIRALRHTALGRKVNLCTAKRTLGERDVADYKDFFDFFGAKAAYIHPLSSRQTFINADITFSTLGDLSLLLDEQCFQGTPININPEIYVGLLDEFDYTYYEEGESTDFSYARPTGKTPKQMAWFYQAVNDFYAKHHDSLSQKGEIDVSTLINFASFLRQKAGEDEEKRALVNSLLRDPLLLVGWLQSAYDAHDLKRGEGFTVREANIKIGEDTYPMREIIPLSKSNQKMEGSKFSAGVQQLTATLLNSLAKEKDEAQNFFVDAESNVISSQVAAQRLKKLWGRWEGYTATLSASQALNLYALYGVQVLHTTTNQMDLREWPAPRFYEDDKARLQAVVHQIRICLQQKKSMLFSCKNDADVLVLKENLKKVLTPEELDYFIFYTNEDSMTSAEVLQHKEHCEQWHGGKKQKAMGLIAAGFGRGDNVNVEKVFLFDVNGFNDLIQKGGRTARNGAEGEVEQFYLSCAFVEEEARLIEAINQLAWGDWQNIEPCLQSVEGSEDEKCFARVMLLRDYLFNLQNAANLGYREGLAQFSTWGMQLLSLLDEPSLLDDFTTSLSHAVKQLGKRWIEISSDPKASPVEKIHRIEEQFKQEAQQLYRVCFEMLKERKDVLPEFNLIAHPPITIRMMAETKIKPSHASYAWAAIASCMVNLAKTPEDLQIAERLKPLIAELDEHSELLDLFKGHIMTCQSMSELLECATQFIEKIKSQSPELAAVQKVSHEPKPVDQLLAEVSPALRAKLIKGLSLLNADLSELCIKMLCQAHFLSAEERINKALLVLHYLSHFTGDEKNRWAADYLHHLSYFINQSESDLSLMLPEKPMSSRHVMAVWGLAEKNASGMEKKALVGHFYSAIAAAPEQRLRILSKIETLSVFLNDKEASLLLQTMLKTMASFPNDERWDVFVQLMKRTTVLWNKDRHGLNRAHLLSLWQQLAEKAAYLPAMAEQLNASLNAFPGKKWIDCVSLLMQAPVQFMTTHQEVLFTLSQRILDDEGQSIEENKQCLQAIMQGLSSRKQMLSIDYIMMLKTRLATPEQLRVFLGTEVISDSLTPEDCEGISETIVQFFAANGLYEHLSSLQYQQCVDSLNAMLKNWQPLEVDNNMKSVLEAFQGFLNALSRDDMSIDKKPRAIAWYLGFVYQYPKLLDPLIQLLQASPALTVQAIMHELVKHSFDAKECHTLFKLAAKNHDSLKFAQTCQQLVGLRDTIRQLSNTSELKQQALYDELLTLSADNLQTIIVLIAQTNHSLQNYPAILQTILARSKDVPQEYSSVLIRLLLEWSTDDKLTQERIAWLQQSVNKLIDSQLLGHCFSWKEAESLVNQLPLSRDAKIDWQKTIMGLSANKCLVLINLINSHQGILNNNPELLLHATQLIQGVDSTEQAQSVARAFLNGWDNEYPIDASSRLHFIAHGLTTLSSANSEVYFPSWKEVEVLFNQWQGDPREKNQWRECVLGLAPERLLAFICLLQEQQEIIKNNPSILLFLDYFFINNLPLEKASQLSLTLLQIAASKPKQSAAQLAHLKAGLDRFKEASLNTKKRLFHLIERDSANVESLVFDGVASYIESRVKPEQLDKVKAMIDLFYEQAKSEKGMPNAIFLSQRVQALFDFSSERNVQERRMQRITWMHLLNHQAFVTGRSEALSDHLYQWDEQQNTTLLQKGLECYVKETARILEDKPQNVTSSLNRDLNEKQQTALLALSQEMALIGRPRLAEHGDIQLKTKTEMMRALLQIINTYEASWFKTAERKEQLKRLRQSVDAAMNGELENNTNRYQRVLAVIANIRLEAMDSDLQANSTRFLKLNRQGGSRYLNTLNQMQDMVLRTWVADVTFVEQFQGYQNVAQQELMHIIVKLTDSLQQNRNENEADFSERPGMAKVGRFFLSAATSERQANLAAMLQAFVIEHGERFPEAQESQILLARLREDFSAIPGHLQTLAREVLNRGDALVTQLEANAMDRDNINMFR